MPDWRRAGVTDTSSSRNAALASLPLRDVSLVDGFWKPRVERNQTAALPRLWALLEEHGAVDNLRRLAGKACERRGLKWTDSDVAKWLEAACYVLQAEDDPALAAMVESAVEAFLGAQQPDGYLNSWFVEERAAERWRHLDTDHELYCAGHLFQAAVAHHRISGDTRLLGCACRYADYIDSVFGPGKLEGSPGHPEIELALVELFRATGEKRYLQLAAYFLEHRGLGGMTELEGHAVRALYFVAGGSDVVAETGDRGLESALERLWHDLMAAKVYLTGGVGGRHHGESIGKPYELPNQGAYAETCAAIANAMWQWRLLQTRPDALYADAMETALYNGVLAGVSLSGTEYFYVNPLAADGRAEGDPWYAWARRGPVQRSDWFTCTCCPPNIGRMLASLQGYLYGLSEDGVYAHLYAPSTVDTVLRDGRRLQFEVVTDYPWGGDVAITIGAESAGEWALHLRIPAWAEGATVDGVEVSAGSYAEVRRSWRPGDAVRLSLPVRPRLVTANHRHRECWGQAAVVRGPLVYCVELADNDGFDPVDVLADRGGALRDEARPDLLDGITAVRYTTPVADAAPSLYHAFDACGATEREVVLVPYYAWANRGPGAMAVWLPLVD